MRAHHRRILAFGRLPRLIFACQRIAQLTDRTGQCVDALVNSAGRMRHTTEQIGQAFLGLARTTPCLIQFGGGACQQYR